MVGSGNACEFNPTLGRFAQPDSLIPQPGSPLGWDRYAYINNNPVNGTDSSGHCIDGLTTIPCLIALIAVTGFAGGAANYEFNVSGNSWWESTEDALATAQAGLEGALMTVGAALTAGETALMAPDAAMYFGSKTSNASLYTWGATQTGAMPPNVLNLYSNENVDNIESYLNNTLDAYNGTESAHNPTMIQRQRDILVGKITATQQDTDWMHHELYERNLVVNQGINPSEAHQMTLEAFTNNEFDLWPTDVYWQHRETLGNSYWDKKMDER